MGSRLPLSGEQVDARPVDQALSVRRRVCLTVAVRQRELAVPHGIVDLAARRRARPTTDSTAIQSPSSAPNSLRSLELINMAPSGSSRRHAGSRKIWLALNMRRPPAASMNGSSGWAPAACGSSRASHSSICGTASLNLAVGMADQRPDLIIVVPGKRRCLAAVATMVSNSEIAELHDPAPRPTRRSPAAPLAAIAWRKPARRPSNGAAAAVPSGSVRPSVLIEHQGAADCRRGFSVDESAERRGELRLANAAPPPAGCRAHCHRAEGPGRSGKPRVDLGFRQGAGERRQYAGTDVKIVGREFEVEQREFGLLVLRGGRENIMREPCGFGHRDVDHHAVARASAARAPPPRCLRRCWRDWNCRSRRSATGQDGP